MSRIKINEEFIRPAEIAVSFGNPTNAKLKLGWEAESKMKDVVSMMILG